MRIDERNIEVLDDLMLQVLRKKTPQQRLIIAFNMWSSAKKKKQLTACFHSLHSDWDEEKIQYEVARRLSHGALGK